MLQPTTRSDASGSNAAGSTSISCPTCGEVVDADSLAVHKFRLDRPFHCPECGRMFAKDMQMKAHRFRIRGTNISGFVCYMPDCFRKGLACGSLSMLVTHFSRVHNAQLADNEQTAADSRVNLVGEPSSDEESSESDDDMSMADIGDDSADESEEDGDEDSDGDAQRLTRDDLQHENARLRDENQALKNTIVKLELDHATEIVNIQNQHRNNLMWLRHQLKGAN